MKKKLIALIAFFVVIVCMCTGCNRTVKEKDIKADLESYTQSSIVEDGQKIDKVEIEKRNTDKKQKYDQIWCAVTIKDGNIEYKNHYILTYLLYDQGGWNLEDVSSDDSKKDTVAPLKGVTKKNIKESLEDECIKVDGKKWIIEPKEIKDIEIKKQKTDLKAKTDKLTVKITLESKVEKVSGELKLKYRFTDDWIFDSLKKQGEFKVSNKKGKALETSEETLISAIENEEISYDSEEFSVNQEDISNFKIESEKVKVKGEQITYKCSFDFKKTVMSCNIKSEITYEIGNDGKWNESGIKTEIDSESVKFDLTGEWKGTFEGIGAEVGTAELNITNMGGDNISAVYSYIPDTQTEYVHSGSYNVSGSLDKENRLLKLTAGDWVNAPAKPGAFEKLDISAEIDFENGTITGKGHDSVTFTVKK